MKLISENQYKTFENHRQEPYFTFLKEGKKTIEGRINKKLYKEVAAGDHIFVQNVEETQRVEVEVIARREYASFAEMLSVEPVEKVLPDIHSIDDAIALYRSIYDPLLEQGFGVVAIEVRLVETQ